MMPIELVLRQRFLEDYSDMARLAVESDPKSDGEITMAQDALSSSWKRIGNLASSS